MCKSNNESQPQQQQQEKHLPDVDNDPNNDEVDGVDRSGDSLDPLSLLDLPIITDIAPADDVTELIAHMKREPSIDVGDQLPGESNFLTIDNHNAADVSEKAAASTNAEDCKTPVLWGCKQCDFR